MSNIECPFCKFSIPAQAQVCGHCGAESETVKVPNKNYIKRTLKTFLFSFVVYAFIAASYGEGSGLLAGGAAFALGWAKSTYKEKTTWYR